ncbi:hypothetical protein ZIOFF_070693 [Zingiber officinale]|uniref:Uncharacterized protein n=1 Tax=Zingiber officinale TaxID=94328 RepID=A0A8J5C8W9_ZINOF|nr:hypothetical protein ZIOFF_070693 [Zingiber officinale]
MDAVQNLRSVAKRTSARTGLTSSTSLTLILQRSKRTRPRKSYSLEKNNTICTIIPRDPHSIVSKYGCQGLGDDRTFLPLVSQSLQAL